MGEMENNKINEEQLNKVAGGNDGRGDRLKVDGITTDGKWYRFWMYDPKGGECNGYIFKAYTELD